MMLNPAQKEAVDHTEGPLLILAGAGSGKTRVITYRIAHLIKDLNTDPENILAITFTNKAAKEMKDRVKKLAGRSCDDMAISTFHSFGLRILKNNAEECKIRKYFSICDDGDRKTRIKDVCKNLNIPDDKTYCGAVSMAKMRLLDPDTLYLDNELDKIHRLRDVYEAYEKRLFADNMVDFDDLIKKPVQLFCERKDILEGYQKKYKYIMVDEYQDTDHAQFELIRLLADRYRNLCVVGDDDQSIYSFRGADISNILDFEREYPDAKVVKLEQNYRSTKSILNAANNVIHHNINRMDKTLYTENPAGEGVNILKTGDQKEEARFIAMDIAKKGGNPSEYAVLYRMHAQSRAIEEAFLSARIPYQIIGGTEFYNRREIRDILAFLRTVNDINDSVSVKRIINVPKRGIGKKLIEKIEKWAMDNDRSMYEAMWMMGDFSKAEQQKVDSFLLMIETIKDDLKENGFKHGFIHKLLKQTDYYDELNKISDNNEEYESRLNNIMELESKLDEYIDTEKDPTLSGFLEDIALITEEKSDKKNAVSLMTIHSAKGLEFEHVYMPGMEEDIFPFAKTEDTEEERRLCYVGMTRAKKSLTMICTKERMLFGRTQRFPASRFLKEAYNDPNKKVYNEYHMGGYIGNIKQIAAR